MTTLFAVVALSCDGDPSPLSQSGAWCSATSGGPRIVAMGLQVLAPTPTVRFSSLRDGYAYR